MPTPNVKICTPLYRDGGEHPAMLATVHALLDANPGWAYQTCVGPHIWRNRNRLVDLSKPWTHFLFLDADVSCSLDTIGGLLRAERGIVGAAYQMRTEDHSQVWCAFGRGGHVPMSAEAALYRVEWVGAGCLLVDRAVFEAIPQEHYGPWFRHDFMVANDNVPEDIGFCMHARENHIDVFLDTRHPAVHHLNQGV
jgi:hypothetical protein